MDKTELKKLMMYFIHEHANAMSLINNSTVLMSLKKDKGTLTDEEILKTIECIDEGRKRANKAVDYLYTKLKENE